MSVIMWKVAIWVLQFPAEPYALHAVCIFGRILLAVQRSRCRAIVECEASVLLPAGTAEIQVKQSLLLSSHSLLVQALLLPELDATNADGDNSC